MEGLEMSSELWNYLTDFINQPCKANNNSLSMPAWKGM